MPNGKSKEKLKKIAKTVVKTAVPAAAMVVPGLCAGQTGVVMASTLGANIFSNRIQAGLDKLDEIFQSSHNGILNHDIQRALMWSFIKALDQMEKTYLESEHLIITRQSLTALQQGHFRPTPRKCQ